LINLNLVIIFLIAGNNAFMICLFIYKLFIKHMAKIYSTLLLLLLGSNHLVAQSIEKKIINATGNSYSTGQFTLKVSVGEPVVGKTTASQYAALSQGFLTGVKLLDVDSAATTYAYAIYPNPTMAYVVIEGDLTLIQQVNVYDIYGNLASVQYPVGNTFPINNLESGMYIVQLIGKSNQVLSQFKIIKI
jgi:hypothetical protein